VQGSQAAETVGGVFGGGVSSSSRMVSETSAGPVTPVELVAPPDTVTVLSAASIALSTPVMVTSPVLVTSPAAIDSVVLADSTMSPATAGVTGVADTVIVVAESDALSSVAVTVATPPFSEMEVGDRCNVATGRSAVVAETGDVAFPTPPLRSLVLHAAAGVVAGASTPAAVSSLPPQR